VEDNFWSQHLWEQVTGKLDQPRYGRKILEASKIPDAL